MVGSGLVIRVILHVYPTWERHCTVDCLACWCLPVLEVHGNGIIVTHREGVGMPVDV